MAKALSLSQESNILRKIDVCRVVRGTSSPLAHGSMTAVPVISMPPTCARHLLPRLLRVLRIKASFGNSRRCRASDRVRAIHKTSNGTDGVSRMLS